MNTREREVMDARFDAWWHRMMPHVVSGAGASDRAIAKAAWEAALLAEGSASSEGAEAVVRIDVAKLYSLLLSIGTFADLKGINFEGRPISDAVAEAIGELSTCPPQPAQGEQCSALEVFRIAGGDVECTPNPTAAVAMDCLRDLRQCYDEELSKPERRPIADEVLEPPYFVEVDKNGCAACGHERSWAVVGPGDVAEGQSWLDEEEADRVCERMNAAYYAGRESALPRGLPAGSVKREDVEAFLVKYHAQVWEAAENGGEYDCAGRELAKQFLARFDATAEQPSCGQDARDAARYRHIRRNDVHCERFHHTVSDDCHPPTWQLKHGEELDAAIDAAIAAQQRQGERT